MDIAFLGAPDLMIVMAVALVVFGPKRLPEVGKQVGTFMREMRKTLGQFTESVEDVRTEVSTLGRPDDFFRRTSTTADQPAVTVAENKMSAYRPLDEPVQSRPRDPINGGLSISTLPELKHHEESVSHDGDAK